MQSNHFLLETGVPSLGYVDYSLEWMLMPAGEEKCQKDAYLPVIVG